MEQELNCIDEPIQVLVIGAGHAGLAVAAACKNVGLQVCLLEQGTYLGGNDQNQQGPSEDGHFHDAQFASYVQLTLKAQDARCNLACYAAYHNLQDHVRLSCRLNHLAFDPSAGSRGRWRATFQDLALGKRYCATADFVVLCTGHSAPEGALQPGTGPGCRQLHAMEATVDDIPADRGAVMVVGDGEAAVDCASALALLREGKGVRLVVRQPPEPSSSCPATRAPDRLVYGPSLLDSARRRALHAALQPHYTAPAPSAVGRALIAPTKRRFWAMVKGKAAATVAMDKRRQGPSDETYSGDPNEGTVVALSPTQGFDLVLWAPSFSDPRVMPFLDPALRRALLAAPDPGGEGSEGGRELVLYRGVVHPDVSGLAFVGYESHARSSLLVLELQAQWLVAHLTSRLALPPPAAMRADIEAQRAWRAAALASPLMSTRGSLAARVERRAVQQLLADLAGIVELRDSPFEPLGRRLLYTKLTQQPASKGSRPGPPGPGELGAPGSPAALSAVAAAAAVTPGSPGHSAHHGSAAASSGFFSRLSSRLSRNRMTTVASSPALQQLPGASLPAFSSGRAKPPARRHTFASLPPQPLPHLSTATTKSGSGCSSPIARAGVEVVPALGGRGGIGAEAGGCFIFGCDDRGSVQSSLATETPRSALLSGPHQQRQQQHHARWSSSGVPALDSTYPSLATEQEAAAGGKEAELKAESQREGQGEGGEDDAPLPNTCAHTSATPRSTASCVGAETTSGYGSACLLLGCQTDRSSAANAAVSATIVTGTGATGVTAGGEQLNGAICCPGGAALPEYLSSPTRTGSSGGGGGGVGSMGLARTRALSEQPQQLPPPPPPQQQFESTAARVLDSNIRASGSQLAAPDGRTVRRPSGGGGGGGSMPLLKLLPTLERWVSGVSGKVEPDRAEAGASPGAQQQRAAGRPLALQSQLEGQSPRRGPDTSAPSPAQPGSGDAIGGGGVATRGGGGLPKQRFRPRRSLSYSGGMPLPRGGGNGGFFGGSLKHSESGTGLRLGSPLGPRWAAYLPSKLGGGQTPPHQASPLGRHHNSHNSGDCAVGAVGARTPQYGTVLDAGDALEAQIEALRTQLLSPDVGTLAEAPGPAEVDARADASRYGLDRRSTPLLDAALGMLTTIDERAQVAESSDSIERMIAVPGPTAATAAAGTAAATTAGLPAAEAKGRNRAPPRRSMTASCLVPGRGGSSAAAAAAAGVPYPLLPYQQPPALASPLRSTTLHRVSVGAAELRGRASASAKAALSTARSTTEALLIRITAPRSVQSSSGVPPAAAAGATARSNAVGAEVAGSGRLGRAPQSPMGIAPASMSPVGGSGGGGGGQDGASDAAAAGLATGLSGKLMSVLPFGGQAKAGLGSQRSMSGAPSRAPLGRAARRSSGGGGGSSARSLGGLLGDAAEAAQLPYRQRVKDGVVAFTPGSLPRNNSPLKHLAGNASVGDPASDPWIGASSPLPKFAVSSYSGMLPQPPPPVPPVGDLMAAYTRLSEAEQLGPGGDGAFMDALQFEMEALVMDSGANITADPRDTGAAFSPAAGQLPARYGGSGFPSPSLGSTPVANRGSSNGNVQVPYGVAGADAASGGDGSGGEVVVDDERRSPAWTVLQATRARQEQLVGEISSRLRGSLLKRATARQADELAAEDGHSSSGSCIPGGPGGFGAGSPGGAAQPPHRRLPPGRSQTLMDLNLASRMGRPASPIDPFAGAATISPLSPGGRALALSVSGVAPQSNLRTGSALPLPLTLAEEPVLAKVAAPAAAAAAGMGVTAGGAAAEEPRRRRPPSKAMSMGGADWRQRWLGNRG